MKKRIALDQIKPGSRFSEDVFIDDKNLLVPAKIAVKQKDIDALKRWGVAFVVTEGGLVDDDGLGRRRPPRPPKPKPMGFTGSRELYLRYTELVDRLSQIYDKIRKSEPIESKAVDQISPGRPRPRPRGARFGHLGHPRLPEHGLRPRPGGRQYRHPFARSSA